MSKLFRIKTVSPLHKGASVHESKCWSRNVAPEDSPSSAEGGVYDRTSADGHNQLHASHPPDGEPMESVISPHYPPLSL